MNDYSKITALYSRLSVGNAMEIFRRNNMRFIAVNNGIDNEMPEVPLPAHHGRGFTHADRFGGPKFISSTRKRSRENQKERLQYLATGTVGTATTQGAGYGTVIDKAAKIVNAYPAAILDNSLNHILWQCLRKSNYQFPRCWTHHRNRG